MKRLFMLFVPAVILLSLAGGGRADVIFMANLMGSQEVPPNNSTATGTAMFVLNDDFTALTFTTTFTGLDINGMQTPGTADNLVAGHIHAGPPGVNGPVVWGFFGMPFNDNNPNDVVITPSTTGVGGTISGKWDLPEGNNTTLTAQIPNLLTGNTYFNLHTTAFPGGEIRGQIIVVGGSTSLVPEPSAVTLALVAGAGLVGVGLFRRRAR